MPIGIGLMILTNVGLQIFNNWSGSKNSEDLKKKSKGNEIEDFKKFQRDGAFPPKYSNYKPKKEVLVKSLDDVYTARNKKLYQGLSELKRNTLI